jgi:multiple sugar transport system permease protein
MRRRGETFAVLHRVAVVVVLLYFLAPFAWIVLTSVLPAADLNRPDPSIDPGHVSLQRYGQLLSDGSFLRPMWHSAVVASLTTLLCLAVGGGAAYALARFRFRGRQPLLLAMLATQAIPAIVLAVPLFVILRNIGWLDTLQGLILTYSAFVLPIVVWMLVGFFEDIPPSLERAARIDGCNRWQTLVRIVVPLTATGLASTAIFAFITAWSDFFLALVLTTQKAVTLPVRTAQFQGLFELDYKSAATAGVITTLPVLLLTLVAQKWIVRGLTEGAVKG